MVTNEYYFWYFSSELPFFVTPDPLPDATPKEIYIPGWN